MTPANLLIITMVALTLAVAGTALARRLAVRWSVLDYPEPRKDHARPIPLLGGMAIYAAVLITLVLQPDRREWVELAAILIGGSLVSLCGLWDDRWGLSPYLKLAVQLLAAGILVTQGVQISLPLPAVVNLVLTLLWILGITNAFNLLDNIDGLAGGVGLIAAGYFVLMAVMNGQILVGALAAALFGACAGFLLFNFNPARIFMGDSGSLFLGLLMAALGIKLRFPANSSWVTWMVPVMVLGIPVFDTTLVVVSRLRRGANPLTSPGKDHVSHRLVARGWTRREAVLFLYFVGSALGGVGLFVSLAGPATAYVIAGLLLVGGISAIVWLETHGSPAPPAD